MQIEHLVLGMYETNCFIVSGNSRRKCLIIDPAEEGEKLISRLKRNGLVPEAILLTHGHYDHFLAVPKLQKEWPDLPVYCHPLDCPREKEEWDMGMVFPTVSAFSNIKSIEEGQVMKLAGFEILVMHTPGHTPGSVTFVIEDAMFTGDFLFCKDIGRTDFKGGSEQQMRESLRRVAALDGDYRVYPGHEGLTTLKKEKTGNPYLLQLQLL